LGVTTTQLALDDLGFELRDSPEGAIGGAQVTGYARFVIYLDYPGLGVLRDSGDRTGRDTGRIATLVTHHRAVQAVGIIAGDTDTGENRVIDAFIVKGTN